MRPAIILVAYGVAMRMQWLLTRIPAYRHLYRNFPFYVPESIKELLAVLICAVTAVVLFGRGDHFALRRGALRALVFGFVCTLPMSIGFALTRTVRVEHPLFLLFLGVLFPLTEEMQSRGFAFRSLYRGEGWPWWAAAIVVGLVTGAVHIEKGQNATQILGLFALTGVGGVTFSWLLARWESLWFPFALHMFMNMWWEVFTVGRTALGGWFPFALQTGSVLIAILVTLSMTPSLEKKEDRARRANASNHDSLRMALAAARALANEASDRSPLSPTQSPAR